MKQCNYPTRWRLSESLVDLRAKFQRLEQTNDEASPTIRDLKRIVSQRITELRQASAGTN